MAYCPKCKDNYSIVISTEGSSYAVPVTTEKYNSQGSYVGYEEGETYGVDIKTLPRCSNCYSVFEFLNATSKKDFFYAKKNKLLGMRHSQKPVKPGRDIFTPIFIGMATAGLVTALMMSRVGPISFLVGILVGIMVAFGILWLAEAGHNKDLKEYEDKLAHWGKEFNELKSLTYSNENYERIRRKRL